MAPLASSGLVASLLLAAANGASAGAGRPGPCEVSDHRSYLILSAGSRDAWRVHPSPSGCAYAI